MARPISGATRAAIVADLRRGELTHREVAARHGVSTRTVNKLSAQLRDQPEGNPLLHRLDRLAASAERALELAEASNDGRELSAAIRAAHGTFQLVIRMRQEIESAGDGGVRGEIEKIKAAILHELSDHPELRGRIAARLLADGEA